MAWQRQPPQSLSWNSHDRQGSDVHAVLRNIREHWISVFRGDPEFYERARQQGRAPARMAVRPVDQSRPHLYRDQHLPQHRRAPLASGAAAVESRLSVLQTVQALLASHQDRTAKDLKERLDREATYRAETLGDIRATLRRIEEKVDRKADRPLSAPGTQ